MEDEQQTLPMDDLLPGLDVRPYLMKQEPSFGTIMQSLFNQTEDEGGVVQTQFEVSLLDTLAHHGNAIGGGQAAAQAYPTDYGSGGPASPASAISAASPHIPHSVQMAPAPYPTNVNSAGDYGFSLDFSEDMKREPVNKSSNTYSPTLQKLFANQDSPCPFQFYTAAPIPYGMELRATPVYTLPHDMSKVVRRCPTHMQEFQVGGAEAREHLVIVDPPCHCTYRSDDGRLSVVTPFSPTSVEGGYQCMTVVYRFSCHSSCKGGVNRRPISIIFTLENQGIVYGRATVKVRLCACPGRDRLKEQGNRDAVSADEEPATPEPAKKRRRGRSTASASTSASSPTINRTAPVAASSSSTSVSAPATTTSQKLVQSVLIDDEDDDQMYTIQVKGLAGYRLVKQFADAVELMNEVRHLGGNLGDIRQSLDRTRSTGGNGPSQTSSSVTSSSVTSNSVPASHAQAAVADDDLPASQPASSSQSLPSSQPFDVPSSQSQPLSSSQQSTGSTSGRHVRFTLKRTITPKATRLHALPSQ